VLLMLFWRWYVYDYYFLLQDDSGIFAFMGQQVARGARLYVDIWDHKPPLIFWINAIGSWITPSSAFGVWLVCLLALMAAHGLLVRALLRLVSPPAALAAVMAELLAFRQLAATPNFTETFSLPLQCAALALHARYIDSCRRAWLAPAYGLLAGVLFCLRPNNIAVALVLLLHLLWRQRGSTRQLTASLAAAAGGAALALATVFGPFLLSGTFSNAVEASLTFNFAYSTGAGLSQRLETLRFAVIRLSTATLMPATLLAAVFLFRFHRHLKGTAKSFIQLALWSFILEFFLCTLSGKRPSHYLLMMLVPGCLLIALGLQALLNRPRSGLLSTPAWLDRSVAGLFVAVIFAILTWKASATPTLSPDAALTARVIHAARSNAGPGARMLTWGRVDRSLWFNLGMPAGTAIFHTTPLNASLPAYRSLTTGLLTGIERQAPELIIERTSIIPGLFGASAPPEESAGDLPNLSWETPQLRAWKARLSRRYHAVYREGKYTVWALHRRS
jgi:hypothetical protein